MARNGLRSIRKDGSTMHAEFFTNNFLNDGSIAYIDIVPELPRLLQVL